MIRYWVGVVSRQHVQRGVKGGFAQVCHGKKGPLSRMKKGDFLIYYSPKETMEGSEKCQKFTAIGKVIGDSPYSFDISGGFVPFRLDIEYFPCQETSILPLLQHLTFTEDASNWGAKFRFGLFEISQEDFQVISKKMSLV
jgi:hypothetical protein